VLVCLNDVELELLSRLPVAARWLYVLIRLRMDSYTRVAGRGLTWATLGRELGADAGAGKRNRGDLKVWRVRTLAAELVRAGLLEVRSDSHMRRLEFLCLWAPTRSSKPRQFDRNLFDEVSRPLRPGKGPELSRSEVPELSRALGSIVLHSQSLTPNDSARAKNGQSDKAEERPGHDAKLYPWEGFSEPQARLIYGMVSKTQLDHKTAQAVLDELAGQVRQGDRSGNPIKNLNGYAAQTFRSAERDPGWRMSKLGRAIEQERAIRLDRARTPDPVPDPATTPRNGNHVEHIQALRAAVAKRFTS
jgi:hypothetical protein